MRTEPIDLEEAAPRAHPLRDRVVRQVTQEVLAGRWGPGQRMPTERQLGMALGVSRSVIRDALHVLEAAGVVRIEHGRGIFASRPSASSLGHRLLGSFLAPEDLRQLFELRLALEVAGAGLAALRATPEERESILALAEGAQSLQEEDLEGFARADEAFHLQLHQATHNRVFVHVLGSLMGMLAASRAASLQVPGRARLSAAEHLRVAQRVMATDPDGARAAMTWHLLSVEEAVLGSGPVSSRP